MMRDGTAEINLRDQLLRHEWRQGKFISTVQSTMSRFGNHPAESYHMHIT